MCRKVCFRAADFQGDCFRLGPTRCHKPAVRQQRCKARKSRTLSDQGQKLQLFSDTSGFAPERVTNKAEPL